MQKPPWVSWGKRQTMRARKHTTRDANLPSNGVTVPVDDNVLACPQRIHSVSIPGYYRIDRSMRWYTTLEAPRNVQVGRATDKGWTSTPKISIQKRVVKLTHPDRLVPLLLPSLVVVSLRARPLRQRVKRHLDQPLHFHRVSRPFVGVQNWRRRGATIFVRLVRLEPFCRTVVLPL